MSRNNTLSRIQRAVAMVLEAIYEQSFLVCSYGFRPGRSAHQALRLVQSQTVKMAGRWVLEIDVDVMGERRQCRLGHLARQFRYSLEFR